MTACTRRSSIVWPAYSPTMLRTVRGIAVMPTSGGIGPECRPLPPRARRGRGPPCSIAPCIRPTRSPPTTSPSSATAARRRSPSSGRAATSPATGSACPRAADGRRAAARTSSAARTRSSTTTCATRAAPATSSATPTRTCSASAASPATSTSSTSGRCTSSSSILQPTAEAVLETINDRRITLLAIPETGARCRGEVVLSTWNAFLEHGALRRHLLAAHAARRAARTSRWSATASSRATSSRRSSRRPASTPATRRACAGCARNLDREPMQ